MKLVCWIAVLIVLVGGCATHVEQCEGRLRPINIPESQTHSSAQGGR